MVLIKGRAWNHELNVAIVRKLVLIHNLKKIFFKI